MPDATRFTATTVHAASKTAAPPGRFASPKSPASPVPPETPEQKVARLRAAHLRAKAAEVSQLDRFIDTSRRFFDSGHKITIIGIIIFTGESQPRLVPAPAFHMCRTIRHPAYIITY